MRKVGKDEKGSGVGGRKVSSKAVKENTINLKAKNLVTVQMEKSPVNGFRRIFDSYLALILRIC
jgi:hypothetical protein